MNYTVICLSVIFMTSGAYTQPSTTSTYVLQQTRTFYRTGKWVIPKISDAVNGADSAEIYSSGSANMFRYTRYCVFINDTGRPDWSECTLIFRKQRTAGEDSVVLSKGDSAIYTFNTFGIWFSGIRGNNLFIDEGCCPGPRGLVIYDLAKRDTLLSTDYYDDDGLLMYIDHTSRLIFWNPTWTATRAACPDYDKIEKKGLTPIMVEKCSFNLLDNTLKHLHEFRCVATQ